MPVTQHPLHRSVRAELPHTAPALGRNDQTLVRVRVADMRDRKPVHYQAMHSTPGQVMGLTAAAQGAMPQPPHLEAERAQPRAVARHAEVPAMPGHHSPQVLALLGNGSVHAPSEFDLDGLEFGSQAFGTREPRDHELALAGLPATVREAQEVEGLRLALSPGGVGCPGRSARTRSAAFSRGAASARTGPAARPPHAKIARPRTRDLPVPVRNVSAPARGL